MLGDTAVAVNPEDSRYKHLIGKMLGTSACGQAHSGHKGPFRGRGVSALAR